jgi:hypothetical protein
VAHRAPESVIRPVAVNRLWGWYFEKAVTRHQRLRLLQAVESEIARLSGFRVRGPQLQHEVAAPPVADLETYQLVEAEPAQICVTRRSMRATPTSGTSACSVWLPSRSGTDPICRRRSRLSRVVAGHSSSPFPTRTEDFSSERGSSRLAVNAGGMVEATSEYGRDEQLPDFVRRGRRKNTRPAHADCDRSAGAIHHERNWWWNDRQAWCQRPSGVSARGRRHIRHSWDAAIPAELDYSSYIAQDPERRRNSRGCFSISTNSSTYGEP